MDCLVHSYFYTQPSYVVESVYIYSGGTRGTYPGMKNKNTSGVPGYPKYLPLVMLNYEEPTEAEPLLPLTNSRRMRLRRYKRWFLFAASTSTRFVLCHIPGARKKTSTQSTQNSYLVLGYSVFFRTARVQSDTGYRTRSESKYLSR